MRLVVPLLAIVTAWTGPASAGAWPREQGGIFASVSYELTAYRDALSEERMTESEGEIETFGYTALYAEYGLTDWVTIGIDSGFEPGTPDSRTSVLFARVPVVPPEWRTKVALEFGIGEREIPNYGLDRGDTERIWRPGVSVGRGFDSPAGPAWANLDLRSEERTTTEGRALKADLTLGVAPSPAWLAYLQVQTSDYPGAGRAVRLVPTAVRRITPWLAVESALLFDVAGGERAGVKLGLWLEF